jgi:hypothetical protein
VDDIEPAQGVPDPRRGTDGDLLSRQRTIEVGQSGFVVVRDVGVVVRHRFAESDLGAVDEPHRLRVRHVERRVAVVAVDGEDRVGDRVDDRLQSGLSRQRDTSWVDRRSPAPSDARDRIGEARAEGALRD